MSGYLLDTHTLLWLRFSPNKLPSSHRRLLESPWSQKYISTISVWEISLKFGIGKLDLEGLTPEEFLQTAKGLGFSILSPLPEQYASFHHLPKVLKHKDPFDRMLVWQAIQDNLTLLSSDSKLPDYNIHGLLLA
jgi:PIN domain nuclease of toxin-antitoxin system